MKNKKYHTIEPVLNPIKNRRKRTRTHARTHAHTHTRARTHIFINICIHKRSLFWIGTDTSITKSGGLNLFYGPKLPLQISVKCSTSLKTNK